MSPTRPKETPVKDLRIGDRVCPIGHFNIGLTGKPRKKVTPDSHGVVVEKRSNMDVIVRFDDGHKALFSWALHLIERDWQSSQSILLTPDFTLEQLAAAEQLIEEMDHGG